MHSCLRARTVFNLRPNTPNIGNELLALGTDAILRSVLGGNLRVVSLPVSVNGGVKGGGLTAQTVYEINQLADGLLIGPGNIFENGALNVDLRAMAALSVPTMVFSVSMGRVFDRSGHLAARTDSIADEKMLALCRIADPILVRDIATGNHLAKLGCDDVKIAGCPTLFIGDIAPDPEVANTILISVRHPGLMSIPNSAKGRVPGELRRMIDHFRHQGIDARLLCHDYQDLAFAQAFPDVPALYTEDPWRFLSWLRGCRLNVGFRLHAFLCCLALGTPSIPLTYDERSMSLIETVGLSNWTVQFLHSKDVLRDVQERCDSLSQLEHLTRLARPAWDALRESMVGALQQFAVRMDAYADNRVF